MNNHTGATGDLLGSPGPIGISLAQSAETPSNIKRRKRYFWTIKVFFNPKETTSIAMEKKDENYVYVQFPKLKTENRATVKHLLSYVHAELP